MWLSAVSDRTMTKSDDQITPYRKELERCPSGDTDRGKALFNLAVSMENRFLETNDIGDLEEAIRLHRTALVLRPEEHICHSSLSSFAWCLHERYRKQGTLPDLDEATKLGRAALDLCPEDHPNRSKLLHNLAVFFSNRYDKLSLVADLKEAITLGRAALQLRPPGHSDRASTLSNLGSGLSRRFLKLCDTADLDEALSLHRSALDLRPEGHPNRSDSLLNLAVCFSDRYDKRASLADFEEAITLGRAALELFPPGHYNRAPTLYCLGLYLRYRFLRLGATVDFDEALSLHRSALELCPEGHPGRSYSLLELAACFSNRYHKQGSVADLEEAITLGRAALELRPSGHSDRAFTLNNLGLDLNRRFLKLGATADLDEAFSLHRSALDLRPEGHPNRSESLHNLAGCFSDRYNEQGSVTDLEEAITLWRTVLELSPPGHCNRALILYCLGFYLRHRFQKLGATADLDEAISHHRLALNLRPAGHSDRLASLNQLVSCLGLRFEKLEAPADLDDLIALNRAILDLHPPDHDGHAKSIDELLCYLRKRSQKLGMTTDLEECVTLGRTAIGLHKQGGPDHAVCFRHLVSDLQSMLCNLENSFSNADSSSDHIMSLHNLVFCVRDVISQGHVSTDVGKIVPVVRFLATLTTCLQRRFQNLHDIADLDEAIILYKEVLKLCPLGSHDHAPTLHKLAWCLSQRFINLSTRIDLDDAIKFEQEAFMLYPPDHPDRVESLRSLAGYRQLKMKWRGASPRPDHPGATANLTTEQVVSNIAFDVLKAFPLRLLDVHSGILCDRGAQISHFKNSQEYRQLVSSTSTLDKPSQTARMRGAVSTYFQYVTLSHRWGASEPLLRDIKSQVIYDLDPNDGLSKLQSFCLATLEHGHIWAWSDTCCIDKESSAELQEAIGSMYSWYRQSVLTMVHLADISDTCSLTSSEWFKRGWTLQELLAPRFLLFFTRDWSLYRGISSNHKENNAILGELEQTTGIMSGHLSSFRPGVDDARRRLQWASTRCTTRPEDIAYSLFGVFGLYLPVLYGESAENALGRLLAEVISQSGDTSILDWVGQPSAFHSCFPDSILPYQTPLQLPSLGRTSSPNIQDSLQSVIPVREMHLTLSHLSRTQFVKPAIVLPSIVHRVKIVRTRTGTAATHVHLIQATGLELIEVTLSQPLENISTKPLSYILIRPWHSNLLDDSVVDNDTSARRWLAMMQQPFSALLLKQLQQNEYKRVATPCHIVARPTASNGALEGEVTTLTIV